VTLRQHGSRDVGQRAFKEGFPAAPVTKLLILNGLNPRKQFRNGRDGSLPFISENRFAIDENCQVPTAAGFDFGGDTKFIFSSFAQAHGLAAKVHSEEAASDFNFHFELPFLFRIRVPGMRRHQFVIPCGH
jgi:hypothetical protein